MYKFIYEGIDIRSKEVLTYIDIQKHQQTSLEDLCAAFRDFLNASGYCIQEDIGPIYEIEPEEDSVGQRILREDQAEDFGWRPISELTDEHKDGRWILFADLEDTTPLEFSPVSFYEGKGWICDENNGNKDICEPWLFIEASSHFLELPPLSGEKA